MFQVMIITILPTPIVTTLSALIITLLPTVIVIILSTRVATILPTLIVVSLISTCLFQAMIDGSEEGLLCCVRGNIIVLGLILGLGLGLWLGLWLELIVGYGCE